MMQLTPYEYLMIDVSNCWGNDKMLWEDRIAWVQNNRNILEELVVEADDPYLYMKAIRAMHDAENHIPTGHMVGLDATSSGFQVMACLTGCRATAKNTNLINTGERADLYTKLTTTMNSFCNSEFPREPIKIAAMATGYGSKKIPKDLFGDGTEELNHYYKTMWKECPGAMEMLSDVMSCWDPSTLVHSWTLPDGHTAYVPVMVEANKKIEVAELDKATFQFIAEINEPSTYSVPLAANITHSVDSYIVREMVRMAYQQGFEMVTIHDAYFAHCNHIQKVRENYVKILADIASKDILGDIMGQLLGEPISYHKLSKNLSEEILNSEYALS